MKSIIKILLIITFLIIATPNVYADEDLESTKMIDFIPNLIINTEFPYSFSSDVIITLTNDNNETFEFGLYKINDYKSTFEIEEGNYSISARVVKGDELNLYAYGYPEKLSFNSQNDKLQNFNIYIGYIDESLIVQESNGIDKELSTDVIENETSTNDEVLNPEQSANNNSLIEENQKKNSWLPIIIEALITAGILSIAYVVLKKKFDN